MTLKACIVGLGTVGAASDEVTNSLFNRTHAGSIRSSERISICCGVDVDGSARERFSSFWRTPSFPTLSEALEAHKPDIVCIATPPEAHASACRAAITSGISSVICEKPFVLDLLAGKELVRLAKDFGCRLYVNHWMRWSEQWERTALALRDNTLGEIKSCRYTYSKGVFNSGTHAFDILRYLFGESEWVVGTNSIRLDTGERNIDGRIGFKNGLEVQIETQDYRESFVTSCEIVSSAGRLLLGDTVSTAELTSDARAQLKLEEYSENLSPYDSLYREVSDAFDANDTLIRCSGQDGLQAVRIAQAFDASLENDSKRVYLG